MKKTNNFVKTIGRGWLMAAAVAGGCKSPGLSHYVSPRIEGRLVDSGSHQPISDVVIRWLTADEMYRGEDMKKAPAVRTGTDGRFVMDSERDFALFGKPEWYSVSLFFQHPGYEGYTITYTWFDATNTLKGEPLVRAGDIVLSAITAGQ